MITNYVLYAIFIFVIFLFLKRLGISLGKSTDRLDKPARHLGKAMTTSLGESVDRLNESARQLNRTMSFIVICIDLELIKSGSLNREDKEKILRELLELTVAVYPGYFLMLRIGINPSIKALPPPESMTQKD